ncbi:L,D-transpeptidase [Falsigemmobacter intermedius]|uniref:L,D-transpeptidase n=1 Tax=Falsigemmobacter intermedius TaxID=1553448 RepID=UPI003F09142B
MLCRLLLRSAAPGWLLLLAACAAPEGSVSPIGTAHLTPEVLAHYGSRPDGEIELPAVPARYLTPETLRREVDFVTDERPGTVIVDPWTRHLYYVLPQNRAIRYRVAVGDEGRAFSGEATIPYSRSWPSWRPTENMIREFPDQYGPLRKGMEGGLMNPLGARALYLHRGGRDTFYRIHGTSDVTSIGNATSAGCIRMFHQDVIELETLVRSGAKVVVLTGAASAELAARQRGGQPD